MHQDVNLHLHNQLSATSNRFAENCFLYLWWWWSSPSFLVSCILGPAGHLPQRGAFIYYSASIWLCLGGHAALANAGMVSMCGLDKCSCCREVRHMRHV